MYKNEVGYFCYVNLLGGYVWIGSPTSKILSEIKEVLDPVIRDNFEKQESTCLEFETFSSRGSAHICYRPNDLDEHGRAGLVFVLGRIYSDTSSTTSPTHRDIELVLEARDGLMSGAVKAPVAELTLGILLKGMEGISSPEQPIAPQQDVENKVPNDVPVRQAARRKHSASRPTIRTLTFIQLASLGVLCIIALLLAQR